nr:hypothetical protein [Gemmatimonadales bacterium]
MSRLRLGSILLRLGELTARRQPLDEALAQFAEAIRGAPDSPEGWYGLALAKLELHDQRFSSKEGPYQRIGSDYLHGAVDGFMKALEADPAFGAAAARLA